MTETTSPLLVERRRLRVAAEAADRELARLERLAYQAKQTAERARAAQFQLTERIRRGGFDTVDVFERFAAAWWPLLDDAQLATVVDEARTFVDAFEGAAGQLVYIEDSVTHCRTGTTLACGRLWKREPIELWIPRSEPEPAFYGVTVRFAGPFLERISDSEVQCRTKFRRHPVIRPGDKLTVLVGPAAIQDRFKGSGWEVLDKLRQIGLLGRSR